MFDAWKFRIVKCGAISYVTSQNKFRGRRNLAAEYSCNILGVDSNITAEYTKSISMPISPSIPEQRSGPCIVMLNSKNRDNWNSETKLELKSFKKLSKREFKKIKNKYAEIINSHYEKISAPGIILKRRVYLERFEQLRKSLESNPLDPSQNHVEKCLSLINNYALTAEPMTNRNDLVKLTDNTWAKLTEYHEGIIGSDQQYLIEKIISIVHESKGFYFDSGELESYK